MSVLAEASRRTVRHRRRLGARCDQCTVINIGLKAADRRHVARNTVLERFGVGAFSAQVSNAERGAPPQENEPIMGYAMPTLIALSALVGRQDTGPAGLSQQRAGYYRKGGRWYDWEILGIMPPNIERRHNSPTASRRTSGRSADPPRPGARLAHSTTAHASGGPGKRASRDRRKVFPMGKMASRQARRAVAREAAGGVYNAKHCACLPADKRMLFPFNRKTFVA